jgi:hypothetical protein
MTVFLLILPNHACLRKTDWQIVQFPSVPKNKLSQKISDKKSEQRIDIPLEGPLNSELKMDARIL